MTLTNTSLNVIDELQRLQQKEKITELLYEYARRADRKDIEGWSELFAEEAKYFVIPRDNWEQKLQICLMYDDSKSRILDRVAYVRQVWDGHFNNYQPRHMISGITIQNSDGNSFEVISHFVIFAYDHEFGSRMLAMGEYHDIIVEEDHQYKFKERKVIIDNNTTTDVLVYPI